MKPSHHASYATQADQAHETISSRRLRVPSTGLALSSSLLHAGRDELRNQLSVVPAPTSAAPQHQPTILRRGAVVPVQPHVEVLVA